MLRLEFVGVRPVFPEIAPSPEDPFLRALNRSGKTWAVLLDQDGQPRLVLSTDDFIREAMFDPDRFNPLRHCHRPILVHRGDIRLGELIQDFRLYSGPDGDDIVEDDVVLLWDDRPRVLTGTDILGRLLRGIATRTIRS